MIGLLGQGAVVVEAGTGRLSMPCAVAKHFERVEVLERNRLTRGAAAFNRAAYFGRRNCGRSGPDGLSPRQSIVRRCFTPNAALLASPRLPVGVEGALLSSDSAEQVNEQLQL